MTYAAKIDKAEAQVDWTRPAVEVDRLIRGLSPFPGAWTEIGGERVKLLASRLREGQGAPGTVLDDALTVACGDGAVQHYCACSGRARRRRIATTFLRGRPVAEGTQL